MKPPNLPFVIAVLVLLALVRDAVLASGSYGNQKGNTWAVLVDTSMFWFNYRHASGTLAFYRTVKQLGIPDEQVILMIAGPVACDPRNAMRGRVFIRSGGVSEVYAGATDLRSTPSSACGDGPPSIDYRGAAVTVDAFLGV